MVTKTEELHDIVSTYYLYQGTGHMHEDLGVVWLYFFQDSLQPFSRWITALHALRPSVKSKGKKVFLEFTVMT